jgi:hypothetical protein
VLDFTIARFMFRPRNLPLGKGGTDYQKEDSAGFKGISSISAPLYLNEARNFEIIWRN